MLSLDLQPKAERRIPKAALGIALALLGACLPAYAQYEVEQARNAWVRALVDVRVASDAPDRSWTEHGPRKLRDSRVHVAIEAGAILPWNVRAQAQIDVQPDVADDAGPWLIEAFLRKEWGEADGFGLQAGVMNLPFSLEHVGAAWTPQYALSASALNTWLWEEASLAGVEAEWWRSTASGARLGLLVGAGLGPDQLGRLLALRGWVVGDHVSGLNADLPLPNGTRTDIFEERDDRPAGYAWLTWTDASERASLRLGVLDNFGDETIAGVWNTQLATAGALFHPHRRFDVAMQYLRGEAHVRDPANDSALRAWYALASYYTARHRVSVRYDWFRARDLDGGNPTDERGDGVTAAWLVQIGLRHRVGVEHTWLQSRRAASTLPELSHDGWQLSYRFRY
jgi:hypothetical protein